VAYPAPARLLSTGTNNAPVPALTSIRVVKPGDPAIPACPTPPCLVAAFTPLGSPPPAANSTNWQIVAENVEDMQFAFILGDQAGLYNGRACGSLNFGVDDPTVCNPRAVKAVRFSLTVRAPTEDSSFTHGYNGDLEDRPKVVTNDGFLRRTVTAEVQLRNNP
jgi:hypothetical protein